MNDIIAYGCPHAVQSAEVLKKIEALPSGSVIHFGYCLFDASCLVRKLRSEYSARTRIQADTVRFNNILWP